MNPRDIFGIVVRTIGIWLIAQSVLHLATIFANALILVAVILEAGVGCALLLAADNIVWIAYDRVPVEPE